MNNARGYLAEFLVARALNSSDPVRVECGPHDVTASDGTRIEVTSSAFLQSWSQDMLSKSRFGLTGAKTLWSEESSSYEMPSNGRVDVWIFALQACRDHALYDHLEVEQWRFWVASNREVETWGQKTAELSTIEQRLGASVTWAELATAVSSCA